jgi:hypothetical protein
MNVCPDEVIRSLFYNKNNDSLITVSVYATENFSSLKCRSTRIECVHSVVVHSNFSFQCVKCMLLTYWFLSVPRYIRRAKPDAGFPLFQSESLKWPGFVEFDDVNAKVLTYSAQDRYFPSLFLFLFHFYCVRFPPVILSYPLLSNDNSIYKVFDLKNYTMLYSISDRNVQEIKIRYFSRFRLIFCFTVSVSAKTPFW